MCFQFYSDLYTARLGSSLTQHCQQWAFQGLHSRLTPALVSKLVQLLTLEELTAALKAMAPAKSPGHDGIITEFYKCLWLTIGLEYFAMIQDSIQAGALPPGFTKGLIILLHKGDGRCTLKNWRPITLLNVSYKLFAKALQMRLQSVLMEVISHDQSAFFQCALFWIISFLTYETIHYAKQSHQPLLFLKLDFSKAYDKLDLGFFFMALEKLGFPASFIAMSKLLFRDVAARISVNGQAS
jgi:hypothetical protein